MYNIAFFLVVIPVKKVTKTNEKHKKTTSDYHQPFSVMYNYARIMNNYTFYKSFVIYGNVSNIADSLLL